MQIQLVSVLRTSSQTDMVCDVSYSARARRVADTVTTANAELDVSNAMQIRHSNVLPLDTTMVRFSYISLAVLSAASVGEAFTHSLPKSVATGPRSTFKLFADKDDTKFVPSARKQIAFDESKGRFFETDVNEADCIPDEEFCVTDNDTGDLIRLTMEEKERIFLDALQVRDARDDSCLPQ